MYKNTTPLRIAVFTFALTLAISGCESEKPAVKEAPKPAAARAATQPLFVRLDGQEGITAIVDGLIKNIGADPRTRHYFTNIDMRRFKTKMLEYLCKQTGGPCKYTGGEIKRRHAPLQIGNADFDAFMENLTESLDSKKVAQSDKDDLLGMLNKLRPDVVATHGGGSGP